MVRPRRSDWTSGHAPAQPGGQDLQLFAVLGHGPARDLQALLVQQLRDALVGQRVPLVLLVMSPLMMSLAVRAETSSPSSVASRSRRRT
jgi:hypothetical protein